MKKYLLPALVLLPFGMATAQDEPPHEPIPVLRQRLATVRSDTARLSLQLNLADAYIQENNKNNHDLDTALFLLAEVEKAGATRTDRRLQGLFHLTTATAFRERGNRDSAIQHALLATNLLRPNSVDWAKACVEIGYNNSHDDPYQDSVRGVWFQKAIPVFAAISTPDGKEWHGHTLMCLAQSDMFRPAEALPMYLKALDCWKSAGHQDYRNIYGHIGETYAGMGDQAQALHYGLLAVRLEERLPKPDGTSPTTYSELAICYYQQGNSKEALPYFRKAFDLAIQLGDTSVFTTLTGNLVSCSIDVGDFSGALAVRRQASALFPAKTLQGQIFEMENFALIFAKMRQPDSMQPYVGKLLKLDPLIPSNGILRFRTVRVASAYFNMTGKYAQAKKYATEMIRLGGLLGSIPATYIGYHDLSQADSGLGNYKAAMGEYQKYISMKDSIRDAGNAKQVATLKVQYETEKKDKDIQALQHKQELSQLALRQAGLIRDLIIAAAVLLLILFLVSINRYRLKQRSNRQLSLLLKEKEWLLKEIHHRVNNNLQIVMSLLNSQSAYIDNESALTAIHDSQHRVYAMSLIHQKLYNSENVSSIELSFYIRELVSYLSDSFNTGQRIRFGFDIEPTTLDVGQAVPLGLILNEAITNAIKYAFPDGRTGVISISLVHSAPRHFLLVIADDGIGMPDHIDINKKGSLGMTLMRGLSANLNGSFSIENNHGTSIKIAFIVDEKP